MPCEPHIAVSGRSNAKATKWQLYGSGCLPTGGQSRNTGGTLRTDVDDLALVIANAHHFIAVAFSEAGPRE